MTAYVIKTNDERCMHTYFVYEDENYAFGELTEAKLFSNIEDAKNYIKRINVWANVVCKVVEVEIRELGE